MDSTAVGEGGVLVFLTQLLGDDAMRTFMSRYASQVLDPTSNQTNPYPGAIVALHDALFPSVPTSFVAQLCVLIALYAVSAALIAIGFLLRLFQGKFWLFHRIGALVIVPNITFHYSFWAFVYSVLSIVVVVATIRLVTDYHFPSWYIGFQGSLPLVLLLGQYSEIWATFSNFYVRKIGSHQGSSKVVFTMSVLVPVVYPLVVVVPPMVLFGYAGHELSIMLGAVDEIDASLKKLAATWRPGDEIGMSQLGQVTSTLVGMISHQHVYAHYTTVAFVYVGAALALTCVIYSVAAVVEVKHLRDQAQKMRRQAGIEWHAENRRLSLFRSSATEGFALSDGNGSTELLTQAQSQARLVEWAATNRLLTAILISLMLLVNAALSLCFDKKPISLFKSDARFQLIVVISAWINSTLSTLVALLILFRSFDGSDAGAKTLIKIAPWAPLPPVVGLKKNQGAPIPKPDSGPTTMSVVPNFSRPSGKRSSSDDGMGEKIAMVEI